MAGGLTVLEAAVGVQVGDLAVDVDLTVGDDEVVAVLGPNGAGKTTVLRALAGLLALDRGRVALDGTVLDDPSTGTFVAARERSIGVVFQDLLLFPRLSALDNVAFGLRARGAPKAGARARAGEWLERLGIGGRAGARPSALSGGEAQRVALARALITEPRLLLLDEPLSALDAGTRASVRTELRRHLADVAGSRLLVTHDPIDALVLADRLVIVEGGRVVQAGTGAEVTARPASHYVARLVGLNLLEGRGEGERVVRLAGGAALVVADPVPSGEVAVVVRPQAVALHGAAPEGSPRNAWPATVSELEASPHDLGAGRVRVGLDGPVPLTAEVTPAAVAELGLAPGRQVWASVKAVDLAVYPR